MATTHLFAENVLNGPKPNLVALVTKASFTRLHRQRMHLSCNLTTDLSWDRCEVSHPTPDPSHGTNKDY
eukprot:4291621-Amphidinium_carterae.1